MIKVYVSSSYQDLRECRDQVREVLRHLEVQDVAMETSIAEEKRPVEKCLNDVRECDLYLGIFAWRYGYMPNGYGSSITELEYRTAGDAGKDRLIFILHENAPWPPPQVESGRGGERIRALRSELAQQHICSFFRTPQDLGLQVAGAVGRWLHRNAVRQAPAVSAPEGARPPSRADRETFLDQLTEATTFDIQALAEFRSQLRSEIQARYPPALNPWEFLDRTGLRRDGHLTRTGALLFGTDPTAACPTALVKCTRYYGVDRSARREGVTLEGTVPSQIVAARQFVADNVRRGEMPSPDMAQAAAVYDYPMIAVREIIANALVHREYASPDACVHVQLFADRLEVTSPGTWLGRSLEPDAVVDMTRLEGQSVKRNFRLAHLLNWIRLVEGEGSGIPSVLRACQAMQARAPTVVQGTQGFVTVTLQRSPPPEERWQQRTAMDPASLLLERIADVARVRYRDVKIRRVDSALSLLVLTRQEDGIFVQWQIAGFVGTPEREDLDRFLATDPAPGSELVYQGPSPGPDLREDARRRGVRLRSFIEFQGLLDLSGYVADQTARLRADRLYAPELYVPQRFRELDRADRDVRDDLASELMRLVAADQGSFVLLLGDFGRGKTFVLHEVARRIAEQLPHMVPILIQLRVLDKAHSVEGLVAAHLANHGEQLIDLRALRYMLRQGRVVLLFDGFDELVTRVTYDRASEHLDTLLHAAEGQAKIILSSRAQHFQSSAQVLMALGERVELLPQRRILSVEPFTRAQIHTYLRNRYGSGEAADRRLELISGVQDLVGLSENPRMLSFIADLDEGRLRAVARAGRTVSAAGLYEEILSSWLAYEEARAHGELGTVAGLSGHALRRAVTLLAQRLWAAGEPVLRVEDLYEVADTLAGLTEVPLSTEQTVHAVGAGSLLVRTDEGAFGFIHDSVAEWLVAAEIARQLTSDPPDNPPQLSQRVLSQLAIEFLCDLAGVAACERWTRQLSPRSGDIARGNAMRITGRLRTSPTADLRGVSLHGEDLSGRNFQGVDLTGADLSEARLVGTNLEGAILRGARLVGARLDEAMLAGADLTNADFRRARLAHADLRGATLTGSRWNLAALIDVQGLPEGSHLRAAAVVPGQAVVTEFAPAEISVRHGFHPGVGRLPESLSYSRDGGTLAIGSEDGGVLVCETANGRPVRSLQGHRGRVFAVAYGPDDRQLFTGASDGDVRIWDAATGACQHVLRGQIGWAWPVVVSPAGDVVVSGDATGLLRLWSTESGRLLQTMPHENNIVYTASFHPSGRLLAAGYEDGAVRVWDLATGRIAAAMQSETGSVFRVAFSPSGATLAIAEREGTLRLWDPHVGVVRHRLVGHEGSVYGVAHHPTRAILASGDTHGVVRLWDTTTGQSRAELLGHGQQPIYWVGFSPNGEVLASGDGGGSVRLWDSATGAPRHVLSGHSGSVWPGAFRPDSVQLAISDDQFTVRLWDPTRGQMQHELTGHGHKVTSVSFSADGGTLATSGSDGVVRLWNPRTGQLQQTLIGTEDRLITLESAAFDPTGRRLATVSNDGRVNLRNLESGGHERHLNVDSPPVWALAFSPTGDMIATAEDDDKVRLWWRQNGRLMHTLADHRERVRSIAFHPTNPVVATGCGDQKVRLWSPETGELLRTLEGHTDRVYAVSFSADGSLLASASWDGTIRVWTDTGEPGPVLRQHTGRLFTAAFGPTGSLLASAGMDLAIRLWDAASGEHLHTFVGHSRPVWSLAFSPDGGTLASAGDDGTARLWSLGGGAGLKVTLLGRPGGWAAIALDGRYKVSGDVSGQFWHAIGMCRFEPGELDDYLPNVRHLPADAEF